MSNITFRRINSAFIMSVPGKGFLKNFIYKTNIDLRKLPMKISYRLRLMVKLKSFPTINLVLGWEGKLTVKSDCRQKS